MSGIDIGPKIGIEGEKQFKDAMKAVNSQIKTAASSLKVLAAESEKSEDKAKSLSQRQKALGESLSANNTKMKTLTAQYDRQKSKLDDLGSSLEKARKENGEGSDEAIKAENAYSKQAKAVNDLETQINTAKIQIFNISGELETNAIKLQEAKSQAIQYGNAMKAAGNKISEIGAGMSKAGGALTAGLTVPIIAAGTAAVAAMDQVDEGLDTIMKKTGATGDTAKELQGVYSNVAKTIPADFKDIGAAVGEINTRLDFSGQKLEAASSRFLKFAKVNDTDVNNSVQLVTRAMKDAGIQGDDYGELLDMLTVAAQKSGISIESLTTNLAKYGAPMRALGIDTETSIAMFAGWEKAGVNTEIAFSGMKKAISNWGAAGKDSTVEFEKALDSIKSAPDIANATSQAIEIFGAKAGPDLADAIRGGRFEVDDYIEALKTAGGTVESTYGMIVDEVDDAQLAMQTAKIAVHDIGEIISKTAGPILKSGAESLAEFAKGFDNLSDSEKEAKLKTVAVAAAAGPVLKIVGTSTTKIGKLTSGVGGLVKDMGKLSSAKKAAQAIGEIGNKSIKSVEGVSGLSKVLFKLASPGGAVLAVAGGLLAASAVFSHFRDEAIKADIAAHFGNVKLSAEEVEDVAKRLTTTDWTVKIGAVVEAKAKLEQAEKDLESSIETLNTLDWKVQVGLELTDEETSSYKSAIDGFVNSTQEYVAQQGYTISLALDATIGKDTAAGDGLTSFSNDYFASAEAQLQELGERLAEKVNKSFEDGTFAKDRMEIQKIVDQMNGVLQEIQDAEYRATLSNIKLEYSMEGLGIDKASYDKVVAKFSETNQELWSQLQETIKTSQMGVELEYGAMIKAGISKDFAEKFREDAISQIEQTTQENFAVKVNGDIDWAFDQIPKSFNEELSKTESEIERRTKEYSSSVEKYFQGTNTDIEQWSRNFEVTVPPLSGAAKQTISDALEALKPQKEILQSISDDCIAAGRSVPASVVQGLTDIAQREAMIGNVSGMYTLLAQEISNNPDQLRAIQETSVNGKKIPAELGKAISMYTGIPFDAAKGMFGELKESTELSAAEVAESLNIIGAGLDETLAESIASQYGIVKKNGEYMVDNAAQGVKKNTPVFEKASADMAQAGVNKMDAITYGSKLRPPSMSAPYWTPQVLKAMDEMQYVLDSNPLVARLQVNLAQGALTGLNMALSVIPHAAGGIFTAPHLAMVAEEKPGESIIPLTVSRRAEALNILDRTAEIIGYDPYGYAAEAGRALGRSRSKSAAAPAGNQITYSVEDGAVKVEIHTPSTDPEGIYRTFKKRLEQDVKRKEAGHGGL